MVRIIIFGPKRDEETGEWRKLHSEELHNLYSSPNIIRHIKSRRTRLAGYVARMGVEKKLFKVLGGKPQGRRPLGRQRFRWDQNGCYGDWRWVCGVDLVGSG
jgi:hypothetical protein